MAPVKAQQSQAALTLKGEPAPKQAAPKIVRFPAVLPIGSFPANVSEVKKIEKRAQDVMRWLQTFSGKRSDSISLAKGKGSGLASGGKIDPKKRMVMITMMCEKEV